MTQLQESNSGLRYAEIWRRLEEADDIACDGMADCKFCEAVVKALRGGHIHCPDCGHVNTPLHSCADWKAYDAGLIDLVEVDVRWTAREKALKEATGA